MKTILLIIIPVLATMYIAFICRIWSRGISRAKQDPVSYHSIKRTTK